MLYSRIDDSCSSKGIGTRKRELAKFPQITVSGVLDGSYFSDISTWYSDSYPLRDVWMSGSNAMKKLYGIKTKQIVSNKGTADEIPVVTKMKMKRHLRLLQKNQSRNLFRQK